LTPSNRLKLALLVLTSVTAAGTIGYRVLADLSWTDALYMSVTTVATVGYGEVVPFGPTQRLFSVALIVTGVGTALYAFTALAEFLIEGRLSDLLQGTTMQKRIDQISGHVILCGHGRFGRTVARELHEAHLALVVVEEDPRHQEELEAAGDPFLIGSATVDEVLEAAGIGRARALVAATGSDADNVFIALAAREKNPRIRVHARAETEAGARRLRRAGVDQVVSVYHLGGMRMAASILRPAVVDFLEIAHPRVGPEVDLEEIAIAQDCALVGQPLGALESAAPRVRVVALKRGEEQIQLIPSESTPIAAGDHLVVIGERSGLELLALRASGRPPG
jgi:voltage-gated potassium channel